MQRPEPAHFPYPHMPPFPHYATPRADVESNTPPGYAELFEDDPDPARVAHAQAMQEKEETNCKRCFASALTFFLLVTLGIGLLIWHIA